MIKIVKRANKLRDFILRFRIRGKWVDGKKYSVVSFTFGICKLPKLYSLQITIPRGG